MSPASTEEYACIEPSSLLLMDKNDYVLENDEGALAVKIVSDSDTRSGYKFTSRQSEAICSVSKNTA